MRVEKIKDRLAAKGIKVFYDKDYQADLWGKDLYAHMADIYANKARFCVIFVSKHYARKAWTNHERMSAQSRAFLDKGADYILYVKIDDTELPGLLPTTGYVTMQEHGVIGIAKLIQQKVAKTRPTRKAGAPIPATPKKPTSKAQKLRVGVAKNFSCSSRISASSDWILLDGWFYKGKVVSEGGGKLRLTIAASAHQEARLNALDPHNQPYSQRRLSYAHRSDASWCQVQKVTSVSSGSRITFDVTLSLQGFNIHQGFYDLDGTQAKIASALLIPDSNTKYSIQTASYFGSQTRSQSPFADFWQRMQGQQWLSLDLLRCARLQAIFHLLSNGLIQEVTELSLGPVSRGILTVKFQGKFTSPYSGQRAKSISVVGKASFGE